MLIPPDIELNQFTAVFAGGVTLTVAVFPMPHKVVCIAVGAAGKSYIVAVTGVLGLSQVLPDEVRTAETYRVVVAWILLTVAVEREPPVSAVYHFKELPEVLVADNTTLEFLHPALETVFIIDGVFTTVAITGVLVVEIPLQLVPSA